MFLLHTYSFLLRRTFITTSYDLNPRNNDATLIRLMNARLRFLTTFEITVIPEASSLFPGHCPPAPLCVIASLPSSSSSSSSSTGLCGITMRENRPADTSPRTPARLPRWPVPLATGLVKGMAHKCGRGGSYGCKLPAGPWNNGKVSLEQRP